MRFCSGLVLELMSMLIAKYMCWFIISQKAIALSHTSAFKSACITQPAKRGKGREWGQARGIERERRAHDRA